MRRQIAHTVVDKSGARCRSNFSRFPKFTCKTASIQEACWRCLSTTSCGVVLRWRSGVTIFCNNETNSQTGEVRDGLNFSADDDKGVIDEDELEDGILGEDIDFFDESEQD